MSQAVAKTLPIGPVQVYWQRERLGSMKSQAALTHSFETVQQGLQDGGVMSISRRTGERATVSVVVDDLKPAQYRFVAGNAIDWESMDTLATSNYTATQSSQVMRFEEEHKLVGTTAITLDRGGFTTGTIEVWRSDWSVEYVRGTDFTGTEATGSVAAVSGGSIPDGNTVHVIYNFTATVIEVGAGGQMADFEGILQITHVLENGKLLQIYGWRAKRTGDTETTISLAAEFSGTPMTFELLADMDQDPGEQLFKIQVEK